MLRIEGHTDNVPIHNAQFQSNWELSTARATELIKLFITRYDFSPARWPLLAMLNIIPSIRTTHPKAGRTTAAWISWS